VFRISFSRRRGILCDYLIPQAKGWLFTTIGAYAKVNRAELSSISTFAVSYDRVDGSARITPTGGG
jgi:hypothetical protein